MKPGSSTEGTPSGVFGGGSLVSDTFVLTLSVGESGNKSAGDIDDLRLLGFPKLILLLDPEDDLEMDILGVVIL